ncbi:MAG: metalloregulator ArsR/SmtB family transcription factor [Nibricoccus sp.]
MDLVFKALADNSRRLLLDRLFTEDGQTLGALCVDLDMTRQAVTKHLLILEEADLVSTRKQGREKLHFLNREPLHRISALWINKYAAKLSTPALATEELPREASVVPTEDGGMSVHLL